MSFELKSVWHPVGGFGENGGHSPDWHRGSADLSIKNSGDAYSITFVGNLIVTQFLPNTVDQVVKLTIAPNGRLSRL